MKLVDILARELKVWPEGWVVCSQDSDSYIAGYSDASLMRFSNGVWVGMDNFISGDWVLSKHDRGLSSDYPTAIVTRAEWQAAVDALNAPKVVEWDGTGLPPAGSTCQIRHSGWAAGSWEMVDIKYISSEYLIIGHGNFKREQHFHMPDIQFRPVLTKEQVAAVEREKGIQAIQDAYTYTVESCTHKILHSQAARLYDAGCRLQVAK